jgi:hypothetical protein
VGGSCQRRRGGELSFPRLPQLRSYPCHRPGSDSSTRTQASPVRVLLARARDLARLLELPPGHPDRMIAGQLRSTSGSRSSSLSRSGTTGRRRTRECSGVAPISIVATALQFEADQSQRFRVSRDNLVSCRSRTRACPRRSLRAYRTSPGPPPRSRSRMAPAGRGDRDPGTSANGGSKQNTLSTRRGRTPWPFRGSGFRLVGLKAWHSGVRGGEGREPHRYCKLGSAIPLRHRARS